MSDRVDSVFPDCFPSDFQENILPKNLPPNRIPVYRICIYDTIDKRAFLSTYEEVMTGIKPPLHNWKSKLKDAGTYSTSCKITQKGAENLLDCLRAHHPPAFIIIGEAISELGPIKVERKKDHVHWWLYKDADPSDGFHRIDE